MPAFLLSIFAWIAKTKTFHYLIGIIVERLGAFIRAKIALYKQSKQIDEQAKKDAEPLKKAQTDKEIDDAAKDVLNNF